MKFSVRENLSISEAVLLPIGRYGIPYSAMQPAVFTAGVLELLKLHTVVQFKLTQLIQGADKLSLTNFKTALLSPKRKFMVGGGGGGGEGAKPRYVSVPRKLLSIWFEFRSISSLSSVIVRVSVVLKRFVGDND